MANHKSALKRARQNEIRRMRNRSVKTRIRSAAKAVRMTASEKTTEGVGITLDTAKSIIDKASKKRVIHRKTAMRKVSRLAKFVNAHTG